MRIEIKYILGKGYDECDRRACEKCGEILQEFPDEPPRLINYLSRGDYFGEVGLLLDGKRIATVRVARNSEVKVMVIDEELFQLFLGNSELTKADIVRRLHQRVMTSHLSNALLNVEPSEIVAVAAQAKVIRYGANSIIIQEGEVAEKFYLILEGEVETLMSDRHDELTSCKLKPGEYFGNAQLVNGENYPFTVRAGLTEVEVMVIDRESFCSLILKSNTNQAIVASVLRHRLMNS